jgi:lipopolysaccharide heptosyltransferase I
MKMLIIKPSSLGDIIHTLPFLKAIKDSFPDARVDWVISKNLKGLIENNPLINEVIVFDKDSWKKIKNLPGTINEMSLLKKILKSKKYDIAADLQGLLRSGIITYYTPAGTKIGFADAREGSRFFYNRKISVNGTVHAVDKCLEIARAIGAVTGKVKFPLTIDEVSRDRVKKLTNNLNEYVVVVPSARWITKIWPAEYFTSLIRKIKLPCVIAGGKGDKEIASKIMAGINTANTSSSHRKGVLQYAPTNIINLAGRTDLKGLVALIAGARAVVSNDTGPMHIAAAFNKPLVALFGPTDPVKTGPYGWQKNKNFRVIKSGVSCSPCFKKKCSNFICMDNISVDEVFEAIEEYL